MLDFWLEMWLVFGIFGGVILALVLVIALVFAALYGRDSLNKGDIVNGLIASALIITFPLTGPFLFVGVFVVGIYRLVTGK